MIQTESGYRIGDIWIALAFLTRWPIPIDHDRAGRRLSRAGWAFPIVGAMVGALGGGVYGLLHWVGVAPFAAAAAALGVQALATGALHEDGLSDVADGLGAPGRSPAERIEIMRDSRVGAFGAVALILALAAKLGALAALPALSGALALVAAGALGRAAPPLIMALHGAARRDGLAGTAGAGARPVAAVAAVLALGIGALAWVPAQAPVQGVGPGLGAVAIAAGLACVGALALARTAKARLGGYTGDVLGGSIVIAEGIALIALGAAVAVR